MTAARRFFCDLLELPILDEWRSEESAAEVVMLDAGGCLLELLAFDEAPDAPLDRPLNLRHRGLRHIAFAVEDLDATWERLEAAGVTLVISPRRGNYFRRFLFCRGPDEILIELVEE